LARLQLGLDAGAQVFGQVRGEIIVGPIGESNGPILLGVYDHPIPPSSRTGKTMESTCLTLSGGLLFVGWARLFAAWAGGRFGPNRRAVRATGCSRSVAPGASDPRHRRARAEAGTNFGRPAGKSHHRGGSRTCRSSAARRNARFRVRRVAPTP